MNLYVDRGRLKPEHAEELEAIIESYGPPCTRHLARRGAVSASDKLDACESSGQGECTTLPKPDKPNTLKKGGRSQAWVREIAGLSHALLCGRDRAGVAMWPHRVRRGNRGYGVQIRGVADRTETAVPANSSRPHFAKNDREPIRFLISGSEFSIVLGKHQVLGAGFVVADHSSVVFDNALEHSPQDHAV
jgi:hypothetical protein